MGTFRTSIEVARDARGPFEVVDALVDTGASYTVLPRSLLSRLHVEPQRQRSFVLADGRRIELPVGEIVIRIGDEVITNLVVFGESDSQALVGAFTLEAFGLAVDPLGKRLVPVDAYLVGMLLRGTP